MALRKRKGETDAEFKRRQELAAKAEPAGAGRQVAVVEKAGKEFVVPKREAPELAAVQAEEREVQERGVAAQPILEEAGAFEEVTPERPDLTPSGFKQPPSKILGAKEIPIVTPITNAILNLFGDSTKKEFAVRFPGPLSPETVREEALREIRQKSFEKGVTDSEKFGTFVESIPVAGSLVSKYARGLVETPSSNAEEVIGEIRKIGETATNNQEKTRSGIMPAPFAMARARQMESEIARLEGRLKLLINSSPILQANTDQINEMETFVLDAKIRTDNFRTAAAFALTAELTGTGRIVPTDEQIFFELKGG